MDRPSIKLKDILAEQEAGAHGVSEPFARFQQSERQEEHGFVYAFRCEGFIKIGYSADPKRRLSKIQVMLPFDCAMIGMIEGGKRLERELHKRLREHRHRGEWFRATPEVLDAVAGFLTQ